MGYGISKTRLQEEKEEKIVARYLEDAFYTAGTVQHNEVAATQYKGIDAWYTTSASSYTIDEKSLLCYINRPLQTQAFELMVSTRNDKEIDGWFLDSTKVNTHFLITYIDSASTEYLESEEDIISTTSILVSKEAVIEYLNSLGWTETNLRKKVAQIKEKRFDNYDKKNMGDWKINGCQFYYYQHEDREGHTEWSIVVRVPKKILMDKADIVSKHTKR